MIRLSIHGPRELFPDGEPVFSSREACALAELARAGVASVLFARSEAVAELRVSV